MGLDNTINFLSGAIPTIIMFVIILLIFVPFLVGLVRFIINLFPPRRKK